MSPFTRFLPIRSLNLHCSSSLRSLVATSTRPLTGSVATRNGRHLEWTHVVWGEELSGLGPKNYVNKEETGKHNLEIIGVM